MVVDAHLAELVDDHGDAVAMGRGEDAVEQGGLARSEKAREDDYGDLGHGSRSTAPERPRDPS